MNACLDNDALFDFAAGSACGAETSAHIASCVECAGLVDDARDLIKVTAGVVVLSAPEKAAMDLFREALRAASTDDLPAAMKPICSECWSEIETCFVCVLDDKPVCGVCARKATPWWLHWLVWLYEKWAVREFSARKRNQ